MHFTLSPENTLFLDKLIRTTDTEFITLTWDSFLEVQLTTPDLSQLTIVKLQDAFFEELHGSGSVSIPLTRFYHPSMKSLRVSITEETLYDSTSRYMVMEYAYADIRHTKRLGCLSVDVFDLDFAAKRSFGISLCGLGSILGKGILEIAIGNQLVIRGKMMEVCLNCSSSKEIRFGVEADRLKRVLAVADRFYESSLCFSEEPSPLNIVFQMPEVHYSTFISTE